MNEERQKFGMPLDDFVLPRVSVVRRIDALRGGASVRVCLVAAYAAPHQSPSPECES